jgi:hypothetical protein
MHGATAVDFARSDYCFWVPMANRLPVHRRLSSSSQANGKISSVQAANKLYRLGREVRKQLRYTVKRKPVSHKLRGGENGIL